MHFIYVSRYGWLRGRPSVVYDIETRERQYVRRRRDGMAVLVVGTGRLAVCGTVDCSPPIWHASCYLCRMTDLPAPFASGFAFGFGLASRGGLLCWGLGRISRAGHRANEVPV